MFRIEESITGPVKELIALQDKQIVCSCRHIQQYILFLVFLIFACSFPDYVIRIFYSHNPSGRTMALGLTQPLTEMSIRIFPGEGGG
jgi:hypothetical protein